MYKLSDLPLRFQTKIKVNDDGCWEWTANLTRKGYGLFHIGSKKDHSNRMVAAHRYSYEILIGAIPEGAVLDHKCRNRACVNPEHLEPVTNQENIRRGLAGQNTATYELSKTHCPQGHAYDLINTGYKSDNSRYCRTCARERTMKGICPLCGGPKSKNKKNCRNCYLKLRRGIL